MSFATLFLEQGKFFHGRTASIEQRLWPLVFRAGREVLGLTKFVEPAGGAMIASRVASRMGFDPTLIDTSEVQFVSSVWGYAISGQDLAELEVKVEGYEHEDMTDPATIMWAYKVATAEKRSVKKGKVILYHTQIARHYHQNRAECIAKLNASIEGARKLLGGMRYRPMCLFEHLEEYFDDPKALVFVNPPATLGWYENYYKDSPISWKEPTYRFFDPATDYNFILHDYMANSKCMVVTSACDWDGVILPDQSTFLAKGGFMQIPNDRASHVKKLSFYMLTNRLDEISGKLGKKYAVTNERKPLEPIDSPILPENYNIRRDSKVSIRVINEHQTRYYRLLWTHNFVGATAGTSIAVFIDDHLVGIFGYDAGKSGNELCGGDVIFLMFAMQIPQTVKNWRINRLVTMLSLCKDSARHSKSNSYNWRKCKRIKTTQLTKHPSVMEHRGIMKLVTRKKDPRFGYRLVHEAYLTDRSHQDTFGDWYDNEIKYRKRKSRPARRSRRRSSRRNKS